MAAMDRSRSRSQSGSFTAEPSPHPINYVLTPSEVRAIQRNLAKVGLWNETAPPPTPQTYSVPTTPTQLITPNVYASWLDDEYLPLTSRKTIRAFLLGLTSNVAMEGVVPAVMGKKSFKEAMSSFASKASIKAGAALALYVSIYRTVLQLLLIVRAKTLIPKLQAWAAKHQNPAQRTASSSKRVIVPEEPSRRSRAQIRLVKFLQSSSLAPFLASNMATLALLLLPPALRGYIALDILVKGLQFSYDEARKQGSRLVKWVPDWMGGGLLYALGNGQLLYAFLFEPQSFPGGYGNIILARSSAYVPARPANLPARVPWPSKREIADTVAHLSSPTKTQAAYPSFLSPLLASLTPSPHPTSDFPIINPILDYAPAHPAHANLLCAVLHPTEPSCWKNFFTFWKKEWVGSARFVAIFAALAQLLSIKKVLKDPETALFKYGMAVLQGATVISGSIGTAWAMTCFWQHYLPRTVLPQTRYFLSGVISSLFILAVPTSRRTDLGLYVAKMSARSSWQIMKKRKVIKSPKNGDVALLALGLALLSALYEERPKALDKSTRTGFRWLIGSRQGGVGAVTVGQQTSGGTDNSYFYAKEKLKGLSSINPQGRAQDDGEDTETEEEENEKAAGKGLRRRARFSS